MKENKSWENMSPMSDFTLWVYICCTQVCSHSLPAFSSPSISPSVSLPLFLYLSLVIFSNIQSSLPVSSSLFISLKKKKNTPCPPGRGCLLSIPLFFILSSPVPERMQTQNVNIWTAAQDGRGVA